MSAGDTGFSALGRSNDLLIRFGGRIVLAFRIWSVSERTVLSDDQSRVNRPQASGL